MTAAADRRFDRVFGERRGGNRPSRPVDLSGFAGALAAGWDDLEADLVLAPVSAALGMDVVCVYERGEDDINTYEGFYVRHPRTGDLHEPPPNLGALLVEGGPVSVDPDAVGAAVHRAGSYVVITEHNLLLD